ncbi:MAG: DUF5689 domain-containing protein [Flavobacterium sp.]
MKNILRLLTVSVFTAFAAGCANSDEYKTPDLSGECTDLTATKPVTVLTTPAPPTYPAFTQYTADDIIEAYVVSSDEGGNIYKSISLVSLDGQTAFSIPVDDYNLYTKYPPGTKVFVNLKNRYYQIDSNAVLLGSLYNNNTPTDTTDDEVGRIAGVEYQSVLTRSCVSVNEDQLVNHLTIAQAKTNQYLNKLVEIDAVQFADGSAGKKYYDASVNSVGSATNHTITDADGNTVIVRVSQYATFASETVPMLSGKIRGVMTKFGSTFQFMIRTLNDVKLTNPRMVALFEEPFTTNFPNWTKYSVTGTQVWTLNTANGNPGNCADMNGYASGAQNNEDWLISPAIDLSGVSTAKLTFQTSRPFSGTNLAVYVSTTYSGSGAPTGFTQLTVPASAFATSTTWKDSGAIVLPASVIGQSNVRIAFKYVSTTAGASQWRVDNVKVQ